MRSHTPRGRTSAGSFAKFAKIPFPSRGQWRPFMVALVWSEWMGPHLRQMRAHWIGGVPSGRLDECGAPRGSLARCRAAQDESRPPQFEAESNAGTAAVARGGDLEPDVFARRVSGGTGGGGAGHPAAGRVRV